MTDKYMHQLDLATGVCTQTASYQSAQLVVMSCKYGKCAHILWKGKSGAEKYNFGTEHAPGVKQ